MEQKTDILLPYGSFALADTQWRLLGCSEPYAAALREATAIAGERAASAKETRQGT